MKSFKFCLVLILTVFMLSGCVATDAQPKDVKNYESMSEYDKATSVGEGFLSAISDYDFVEANTYMSNPVSYADGLKLLATDTSEDEILHKILNKLEYELDDEEVISITESTSKYSLNYNAKTLNIKELYIAAIENMDSSGNLNFSDIDLDSISMTAKDLVVEIVRVDGEWKVDNAEQIILDVLDMTKEDIEESNVLSKPGKLLDIISDKEEF